VGKWGKMSILLPFWPHNTSLSFPTFAPHPYMKASAFLLVIVFRLSTASAQVTLIKGAPNQVFDLACAQCALTVEEVALWKGIRLLPYHKERSGLTNLLHWKYYDSIMKEMVTTSHELPWEKCTQLLDAVADSDTLSLQVNLLWTDSTGQTHPVYLLIGGLLKSDLASLPLESRLEANDEIDLRHFSTIATIKNPDGKTETYEIMTGEMSLTRFDAKTGAVGGSFEFKGNCIGWMKHGTFYNGVFLRE